MNQQSGAFRTPLGIGQKSLKTYDARVFELNRLDPKHPSDSGRFRDAVGDHQASQSSDLEERLDRRWQRSAVAVRQFRPHTPGVE